MRWPWRLHREWGERAEEARAEAEKSRQSLEEAREKVVRPLAEYREHNHFAELIRASLIQGRRE